MMLTIGLTLTGWMRCTWSLDCPCQSTLTQVDQRTMEANMIFKTIRFYDIKSRHGLPKAELQRYWANARLHKVIVILNIITIIMIIIVITAVINWVAQCDQNNQIFL